MSNNLDGLFREYWSELSRELRDSDKDSYYMWSLLKNAFESGHKIKCGLDCGRPPPLKPSSGPLKSWKSLRSIDFVDFIDKIFAICFGISTVFAAVLIAAVTIHFVRVFIKNGFYIP